MARRIVSFTSSGAYVFHNVRQTPQNQPKILLHEGETAEVELDLTNYLETGETITSAAVENHGTSVTLVTATPKVTATATSNAGYAKITMTLSSGIKTIIRLYVAQRNNADRNDYASVSHI